MQEVAHRTRTGKSQIKIRYKVVPSTDEGCKVYSVLTQPLQLAGLNFSTGQ